MPREKEDAWAGALDPHPEGRAKSAFTRVHSPSKTGVNALMDALWRGVSKDEARLVALMVRDAPTYLRCIAATPPMALLTMRDLGRRTPPPPRSGYRRPPPNTVHRGCRFRSPCIPGAIVPNRYFL
jgi:hypothetical protein